MASPISRSQFPVSELERKLITGCLAQDRRAQKELYDRYKDAMFTLSYRITNDKDLAADVLQEAFLGVFRGMHQFRFESTLGAWIKTILVRTAYKKLRKQPLTEMLDESHIGEQLDWGDFLNVEYLEKAIQGLPDGYRSVFVLIEVEGYTHKETAAMLGISVGTSKSQLFYAKKTLQKKLKAMGIR